MPTHIAFEGIDNSGKTTVSDELVKLLNNRGLRTLLRKEFSSSYGATLKERLYSKDSSPSSREKVLAFALDRLIRYEEISDLDYDVVVWDRYVLSAVVYRAVEGVDKNWVECVNSIFPMPDMYLYIDVPPDVSANRGLMSGKRCPYNEDFLARCRSEYLTYVALGVLRMVSGGTVEEQLADIMKLVDTLK